MYMYTFLCIFSTYLTDYLTEGQLKCIVTRSDSFNHSSDIAVVSQLPFDYTCPREYDPKSFTKCCRNGGCCEPAILTMAPSNDWLLMVTAILVISSCLFLTVLSVICCFWSRCPLYNACRANYSTTNVIAYSLSKEDPTPLMPAESNKGPHYKPCTVKIKKMQDV